MDTSGINSGNYASDEVWNHLDKLQRAISEAVETYGRFAAHVVKVKLQTECVDSDGKPDLAALAQGVSIGGSVLSRSVDACVGEAFNNLNKEQISALVGSGEGEDEAPESNEDELAKQAVIEAERLLYEAGE